MLFESTVKEFASLITLTKLQYLFIPIYIVTVIISKYTKSLYQPFISTKLTSHFLFVVQQVYITLKYMYIKKNFNKNNSTENITDITNHEKIKV